MDINTLTALVALLTPFITEVVKRGLDWVADSLSLFQSRLPMFFRIILPLIVGVILQTVGNYIFQSIDPIAGVALGAMAGGLASSGRDLIHKRDGHN